MDDDQQRLALRQRIEQAQQRLSQLPEVHQTEDKGGNLLDIAKRNPLVLIGAAAALGLAIGALARRGSKVGTSSTGLLGRIATDAAIAFAVAMVEKSRQRAEGKSVDEHET